MKIHSLSKVLVLPILILVGLVYYLTEKVNSSFSILVFIPVVLGVVLYIFHGNIDFWYLKKNPYGLDERLKNWLLHHFVPYRELGSDDKKLFEHRLELYINGRLIKAMGSEIKEVPEDIKCMVACHAVWMTLYLEDFLIGDMDRIFLYKHHFPSPKNPRLHAVEVDTEDGVIVMNYVLLAQALKEPLLYYNIALHAFAASILANKGTLPIAEDHLGLEIVSTWNNESIAQQIGVAEIPDNILHIHHFFIFRHQYKKIYPENYTRLMKYFNIPED